MIFKQPEEQYNVAIDWTPALPPGGVIQSAVVHATDQAGGADATGAVLGASVAVVVGNKSLVTVLGGTTGHTYDVQYRVTLVSGEILQENVQMLVQEL